MFPKQWNAFCARVTRGRVKAPCGPTAFYPVSGPGWHPKAVDGSFGVGADVGIIPGSIGLAETAVALSADLPVALLRNPDGHYVPPDPLNVDWALTRAVVNKNLTENLSALYTDKNPLSYPLAYYGYWIVPRSGTTVPPIFSLAAGRSLSTFIDFALCAGQRQAPELGYAPLPRNLVQAGLEQVSHIPGAVGVPKLSECDSLPAPY
jgi:phosphate transport system substrate-binding protein